MKKEEAEHLLRNAGAIFAMLRVGNPHDFVYVVGQHELPTDAPKTDAWAVLAIYRNLHLTLGDNGFPQSQLVYVIRDGALSRPVVAHMDEHGMWLVNTD